MIATDPQSWNRYSYTLNNPLKYVDRNGKWPTAIHRQIIDQALPGLSEQQKQHLKDTSQWVDRLAGQTKAHNHEHAMRSPGEDVEKAKQAIDANIQTHVDAAQKAMGGNTPEHAADISDSALKEFGQAQHTVADRTSPAHTDEEGNPKVWLGIPLSAVEAASAAGHSKLEEKITDEQMNRAVNEVRDLFKRTFGEAALKEAVKEPDPKKPQ